MYEKCGKCKKIYDTSSGTWVSLSQVPKGEYIAHRNALSKACMRKAFRGKPQQLINSMSEGLPEECG